MHTILSIQSAVAYGHVGNSSAVFPMQRRGNDVWPVHTVMFSNHTGYGAWRGPLLAAADIADVVRGIDDRGVLGRADAVLSGYQGGEDVAGAILESVALVKERNPKALYCCDPVMGDVGRGFYCRPGIPELMRDRVTPAADVMTPNHFELDFLTASESTTLDEVVAAARALRERGPETVLVTSVVHDAAEPDTIDMVAVDGTGAWKVTTPRFERSFTGSGDLTAAMFLTGLLDTGSPAEALGRTASIVYGVLRRTVEVGDPELHVVGAQDEIAEPSTGFDVIGIG
ncbi:pyridoxal kinase [Mariniluteicoccus endophyticus]